MKISRILVELAIGAAFPVLGCIFYNAAAGNEDVGWTPYAGCAFLGAGLVGGLHMARNMKDPVEIEAQSDLAEQLHTVTELLVRQPGIDQIRDELSELLSGAAVRSTGGPDIDEMLARERQRLDFGVASGPVWAPVPPDQRPSPAEAALDDVIDSDAENLLPGISKPPVQPQTASPVPATAVYRPLGDEDPWVSPGGY